MNQSDEIRDVLLDILQIGLLRIRAFGFSENPQACGIEADHLHNLPDLIKHPNIELLIYYYRVTRPTYIREMSGKTDHYLLCWQRLAKTVEAE